MIRGLLDSRPACLLGCWLWLTQPLGSHTPPLKAEIGFVYRWTRKGEFPGFLSWQSCGLILGWGVGVERLQGCPGDEVSSSRCQDIVGFNQMQLDPPLPGNRISNSALSSDAARALRWWALGLSASVCLPVKRVIRCVLV